LAAFVIRIVPTADGLSVVDLASMIYISFDIHHD
jgi:hypothetical protein